MNKYKIEFTWFFQGDSFEESVSMPSESLEKACIEIKSVWGEVEFTYFELETFQ